MSANIAWLALTNDTAIHWVGGVGTLCVYGIFAGETVTLQYSPDHGGTWVAAGDLGTFTAIGSCNFELPAKTLIRVHVTGGLGAGLLFRMSNVGKVSQYTAVA